MVRPVILSRPANTARPFSIFSVGVSMTVVSSSCPGDVAGGAVSACSGVAGLAGAGDGAAPCGGAAAAAPPRLVFAGTDDAPGGGASGCAWMLEGPRATGAGVGAACRCAGYCCAGYCCGGEYGCCAGYCCWDGYWTGGGCAGNPLGTSAGGRGGESLKGLPNWAATGPVASVAPITTMSAAVRAMNSMRNLVGGVCPPRPVNMPNKA